MIDYTKEIEMNKKWAQEALKNYNKFRNNMLVLGAEQNSKKPGGNHGYEVMYSKTTGDSNTALNVKLKIGYSAFDSRGTDTAGKNYSWGYNTAAGHVVGHHTAQEQIDAESEEGPTVAGYYAEGSNYATVGAAEQGIGAQPAPAGYTGEGTSQSIGAQPAGTTGYTDRHNRQAASEVIAVGYKAGYTAQCNHIICLGDRADVDEVGDNWRFIFAASNMKWSAALSKDEYEVIARVVRRALKNGATHT